MKTISSLHRCRGAGHPGMRKLLMFSAGTVVLGAGLSACAGPGWRDDAQSAALSPMEQCAAKQLVLPLDHGPRPQTTPYENKLRQQRFDAEMKACRAAAAKGVAR
ncbi:MULTISPECIES: hypothetical protein [unclassified Variovorax]|uniref:hypothetical protein n=1 Tax=unclassified Variovorax TaxID=663243 RepID=UPI001F0BB633|nr:MULTISPECIES: hypothetical protein [unclassified Variovorax]